MNKIYSEQMSKASMLSDGIQKNKELLNNHGIVLNMEKMDAMCGALAEAAQKQEEAEAALKKVRDEAHRLLDELKEIYNESKSPIKQTFPMEDWSKFGIADKR